MVSMLVDLQLADASVTESENRNAEGIKKQAALYISVLQKHKIDNDHFIKSWNYYLHQPEKLDNVYLQVINVLTQLQLEGNNNQPTVSKPDVKKQILPFHQKVFPDSTH